MNDPKPTVHMILTRAEVERIRDSSGNYPERPLADTCLALMDENGRIPGLKLAIDLAKGSLTQGIEKQRTAEARICELTDALRTLLDNLSLYGSCPANNCASEDPDGLGGLREPEPHSDGCAYVAARALLAPLPSGGER